MINAAIEALARLGAALETPRPGWVRFALDRRGGWAGWEAERLLLSYGIRVGGRGVDAERLYFCVSPRQARWAEYILQRAGAPLASAPVYPGNLRARGRGLPPSWGRPLRGDGWAWALRLLDALTGRR
jgi:hypothetical protein